MLFTTASGRIRSRAVRARIAATVLAAASISDAPAALFADRASLWTERAIKLEAERAYATHAGHAVAEGDVLLGPLDENGRPSLPMARRGHYSTRPDHLWPDGRLIYMFADKLGSVERQRILSALDHWTERTGLAVLQRTSENAHEFPDYLRFEASNICASYVGRIGGEQPVWISAQCTVGSIVHEVGHALGFYHEHTRPDRDNFVSIQWNNISSGAVVNFDVMDTDAAPAGEYDYESIMHYGAYFFSRNGEPTIVVPDGVSIGQRDALSAHDVAAFDALYATDLALQVTVAPVAGGFEMVAWLQNVGTRNAADVVLDILLDESATWLTASVGSDWHCRQDTNQYRCEIPALAMGQSTRIEITASSNTKGENSFLASVSARTADSDPSNNVAGSLRSAVGLGTGIPDSAPSGTESEARAEIDPTTNPDASSGTSDNRHVSSAAARPAASDAASAGGAGFEYLWPLLALLMARYRKTGGLTT